MKEKFLRYFFIVLFVVAFPSFSAGDLPYSIVPLQPGGGNSPQDSYELRFDDGSYENGINWYSEWVGGWVGFAKKLSDEFPEDQFLRIENIILAFSRKEGQLSSACNYELAICPEVDGLPDVLNIIWQETYTHSEDIPFAPNWTNVDHIPEEEVLISWEDNVFFLCYFPRWSAGVTPDPPFYFCVDMDSWYIRSYGNFEQTDPDWKTFPELYIVESELGVGVVVSLTTSVQPTGLGEIKALFR